LTTNQLCNSTTFCIFPIISIAAHKTVREDNKHVLKLEQTDNAFTYKSGGLPSNVSVEKALRFSR
jgi:hypothetical protein